MFKTILSTLSLCFLTTIFFAQSVIHQEGFEGPDYSGYTTSVPFGLFTPAGSHADYFLRGGNLAHPDDPAGNYWPGIASFEGNNYLLWEDSDGHVGGDGTITISLDPIDITGVENMSIAIGMAAPEVDVYARYEAVDFINVEYQIDGGPWVLVHRATGGVEAPSSTAGRFRYDDNRDGSYSSSETVIEATMLYFTGNLNAIAGTTVTGSSMNIRVRFLSGVQEEMAIDDIRLLGTASTTPPAITSNPSPQTTCDGSSTTFSIMASNASTYSWEVSTNGGANYSMLSDGGAYSGTSTTTLSVTPSAAMSGYLYRCVAAGNVSPSATSTAAMLTVNVGEPKLTMVDPINNLITITNCSPSCAIDISNYQLCSNFSYTVVTAGMVVAGSLNLAPSASVTMQWNFNATGGDLGIYVAGGSFSNPAALIDWTQWNTAGNGRESVAVAKGIWTAGDFITGAAPYTKGNCNMSGFSAWAGQNITTSTLDVCNSNSLAISGFGWQTINSPAGETILSINPNGNNLGTVTASHMEHSTLPQDNQSTYYIPRYFNLESTAFDGVASPFPSPISIRLFVKNTELAAYEAQQGAGTLQVTHYSGPNEDCLTSNDDPFGGSVELISSALITKHPYNGTEGFYLEFNVSHFSELGIAFELLLPLELLSFTGKTIGKINSLEWSTGAEINFSHFEVERSSNGYDYRRLSNIQGKNTPGQTIFYNFLDENPLPGDNYYRLKLVNEDGTSTYSKVVVLKSERLSTATIYPNPVKNALTFQFVAPLQEKSLLSIYTITGVLIKEVILPVGEYEYSLSTSELKAGSYFAKIGQENSSDTYKFVKYK